MPGFVQTIEWKSTRIEEIEKLNAEWRDRFPTMGPSRILTAADRDQKDTYLTIVEFESYEAAMKNSEDPATSEYAEKMSKLCDGPPVFRNLDVHSLEDRS